MRNRTLSLRDGLERMAAATFNETKQAGQRPEASAKMDDVGVRFQHYKARLANGGAQDGTIFACHSQSFNARNRFVCFDRRD